MTSRTRELRLWAPDVLDSSSALAVFVVVSASPGSAAGWQTAGCGRRSSEAAVTSHQARLVIRGLWLEYATLGWNVVGVVILAVAAWTARSVALAGFGLDSLIEIGASAVVVWELSGSGERRRRRALALIAAAFVLLAIYLGVQSTWVLLAGYHPGHSVAGIWWTAITAAAMFALAYGKHHTGTALGNQVLRTEGRVTLIDALLATAVLAALILNAAFGWWQADPAVGYVLVYYAVREARTIRADLAASRTVIDRSAGPDRSAGGSGV